jgi:hypothetical protein
MFASTHAPVSVIFYRKRTALLAVAQITEPDRRA